MQRTHLLALSPLLLALMAGASLGCSQDTEESVLPGVQAIVFSKRAFVTPDGEHNVAGGANQTIDYLRYTPGGGLYKLSPPTPDGELTNLTADFEQVDINGLDLSFDATQVVFSMRRAGDDHYHIYVANLDGSDTPRQLTFGAYDDVKPIWLPGDRIAFATNQPFTEMGTRADEYNHSRVVTQIATISATTGDADRRVCAQNLSHSADPFLLSDGRIGFSQWEHLGPINDVKLRAMNPDCTNDVALAGQHGKPGNSLVQTQEITEGRYVGITTSRDRTIQSGALVEIDARAREGASGLKLDEQNARFDLLTEAVPTDEESPASGVGRYRRPFPLSGTDELLVSWADGDVNDRNELADTAPNFGIYMYDPETGRKTLVYDDPQTWDLYAVPVREREVPPVRDGVVGSPGEPAVLGSVDVGVTSLEETVRGGPFDGMTLDDALDHSDKVRIIEGFSSEIGPVREFGLTMHEGAAIVGEAQVYDDGSWEAKVPSKLPYHLQPIDKYGLAIRNQLLWIRAMDGEQRRCGGCHEARPETILPRDGATTLAQQAGAQDFDTPIPDRRELPWIGAAEARNIQDVFNDNCVSCHSGGADDPYAGMSYEVAVTTEEGEELTFEVPYLDLSDRPITTYYDMNVVEYPASYVSLLYPSAMMGDAVATGDTPPVWVVPGAARESVLIEKLNVTAPGDETDKAWDGPMHPEDVGVELSREDRQMLIQMADLGGQFYSRKNVEGAEMYGETEY